MCQRRAYLYRRANRHMLTLYLKLSSTGHYVETACQPWVELLISSSLLPRRGSGAQNSAFSLRTQCWGKWDPMKLVTVNACVLSYGKGWLDSSKHTRYCVPGVGVKGFSWGCRGSTWGRNGKSGLQTEDSINSEWPDPHPSCVTWDQILFLRFIISYYH